MPDHVQFEHPSRWIKGIPQITQNCHLELRPEGLDGIRAILSLADSYDQLTWGGVGARRKKLRTDAEIAQGIPPYPEPDETSEAIRLAGEIVIRTSKMVDRVQHPDVQTLALITALDSQLSRSLARAREIRLTEAAKTAAQGAEEAKTVRGKLTRIGLWPQPTPLPPDRRLINAVYEEIWRIYSDHNCRNGSSSMSSLPPDFSDAPTGYDLDEDDDLTFIEHIEGINEHTKYTHDRWRVGKQLEVSFYTYPDRTTRDVKWSLVPSGRPQLPPGYTDGSEKASTSRQLATSRATGFGSTSGTESRPNDGTVQGKGKGKSNDEAQERDDSEDELPGYEL